MHGPVLPLGALGRSEGRQQVREIHIGKTGRRFVELFLPLMWGNKVLTLPVSAQVIVGGPFFGVFQCCVGFGDLLELFFGLGFFGDIGMVLVGQTAFGLFDISRGMIGRASCRARVCPYV